MVAGVRRSRPRPGAIVVVAASAAALLSAFGGAWIGVQELDDWQKSYVGVPESLRDDPVGLFLGFDVESWKALERELDKGDRYVVVARGPTRFEVRNYAAYALLPAIQVLPHQDADVVVYYRIESPAEPCVRIGKEVCVVRREAS
jgi:hypothetical protein